MVQRRVIVAIVIISIVAMRKDLLDWTEFIDDVEARSRVLHLYM